MLDSKFRQLRERFNIRRISDWCEYEPSDLLQVHGVGRVTVDHVRIYLAARDLTLRNDRTPEYWRVNLSSAKIGQRLGREDTDCVCPFNIIVDSAETEPFDFLGIKSDQNEILDDGEIVQRTLIVPTMVRSLGRYPNSLGDYSVDGYVGQVGIERKSVRDFIGTALGFAANNDDGATRRERFECELANLKNMAAGIVVVEGTLSRCVAETREGKTKSQQANQKTVFRSGVAYQQDYKIHFAENRREAEIFAFRFLERYWRKRQEKVKRQEKLLAGV